MIFGKIYTVTEVNKIVKGLIHEEPEFANLQIQREVSNYRQYPSGHCYFNLKDDREPFKGRDVCQDRPPASEGPAQKRGSGHGR